MTNDAVITLATALLIALLPATSLAADEEATPAEDAEAPAGYETADIADAASFTQRPRHPAMRLSATAKLAWLIVLALAVTLIVIAAYALRFGFPF